MVKAHNRRLLTDQDFAEAMELQMGIRVFKDNYIVDSGGVIIQFNEKTIVLQAGVGDLSYLPREACEFFGMKGR
ncbi:MAG: hypothetical protein H7X86_01830 [Gorillibacterium sp.]|nr:hypothetical protein [Gorillibacterium sp.]